MLAIVLGNGLGEALHAEDAGLRRWIVEDYDLTAADAERLDHRLSRLLAATIVVARNVRYDLGSFRKAGDIGCEDGDALFVRLLDHRANCPTITGAEDDRRVPRRNEIADLLVLLRHVKFASHDNGLVAGLLQFRAEAVGDDAKEGVGHRKHRNSDCSLGAARSRTRRRAAGKRQKQAE